MEHRKRVRSGKAALTALAFLVVLLFNSGLAAASVASDDTRKPLTESASDGLRVGRNVQVSDDPHFQREAALAVNPADERNLIVAANDGRIQFPDCRFDPSWESCVWVGLYTSRNGGQSWRANLIPGYPGGPPGVLSEFNLGYDPFVAFDREGTVYAGGIFAKVDHSCAPCLPNLDASLAIARSDDGGRSWNEPVIVDRGQGSSVVDDFPRIAVDTTERSGDNEDDDGDNDGVHDDNERSDRESGERSHSGNVYLSWNKFDGDQTRMMVATSRDRGMSWSSVQVNGPPPSEDVFSLHFDPMVAVGPGGKVFVAWDEEFFDDAGFVTSESLWIAVSRNGGKTFVDPRLVETGVVPRPLGLGFVWPVLAVDSGRGIYSGRAYVTWIDGRTGDGDVLLKWSDDGGVTWSSNIRVNGDVGEAEQYNQWISVAPNGRVDIAFYDRRDDSNNALNTFYYAGSTDGGRTFVNVRVSDASWDPSKFPLGDFGNEYAQIASTDRAAHLAWADGRNAGPDGVNEDIYTATVSAQRGDEEDD